MIQSTFLFASITNLEDKMAKLTSGIAILLCIFFVSSNLYEIHEIVSDRR